jgi:DNA end-binding protein Ku
MAAKRSNAAKSKAKSRPKHRASWRGQLTFGLVSFPVQAMNALNREQSDIHFHQLHKTCHSRIHHQKVCPVHGEVASDEIVSGYEYKKGKYVEIEPEELDALRTEKERSLTIDAFLEPGEIDPLYFDGRMYYLRPDGAGAAESYAVVAEAMEREERVGVGTVVFSGKDQIVLVRPLDGVLHMAMLNYEAEIRPPSEMKVALHKPNGILRKVQLAQTLIRSWTERDFDFSEYEDQHRHRVQELVKAKIEGREVVAPQENEEPEVVNLMEALKKSVQEATRGHGKAKSKRRRKAS